jgi:hypothetical protein
MNKEASWIHKVEEIPNASDESLINALITCDGSGEVVKQRAIMELLSRREDKTRSNLAAEEFLDNP